MCLGKPLDKKALNAYIKKNRKDGSIMVWKVVYDSGKRYSAIFRSRIHRDVTKQAKNHTDSQTAVHAFRSRSSAKRYGGTVVQCRIRPKWIRAIGIYHNWDNPRLRTLTASHMVMPKYPQKSVSLKRFRDVCKEHGI